MSINVADNVFVKNLQILAVGHLGLVRVLF